MTTYFPLLSYVPLPDVTLNGKPVAVNPVTGQVIANGTAFSHETGRTERPHGINDILDQLERERLEANSREQTETSDFEAQRQALGAAAQVWDRVQVGNASGVKDVYKAAVGKIPQKVSVAVDREEFRPGTQLGRLVDFGVELYRKIR